MCSQNQTILLSSSSDDDGAASGGAADESTFPSYSIYQGTLTSSSSSSFHHPLASDLPPPTGNVSGDVSGEEQNLHTIPLSDESTSASNRPTLSGVVSGDVSGNVSGEEQNLQTILLSDKSTSTSSFHHPLDSDPTGDVSGDISGDVSGKEQNLHTILLSDESTSASSFRHPPSSNPPDDVSGNVSGDVSGNVSGDVSGEEQNLHTILLSDELTSASSFHHPLATSPGSDPLSPPSGDEQNLHTILLSDESTSSSFHHPLASSPDSDPLSPPSDDVSGEVSGEVSAPVKCDYLRVSVSDPKKETDSGSKDSYVTYLITTETDLVDYKGSKFCVRRRFKEFVLLSERLGEAYRGFFVPVRPEKGLVEGQVMQKQEFVEQRRVAVERYLRRLARHTVIRQSEELRVFLIGEGRVEFGRGNEIALKTKLARGGDLMRLFRGVKQRVRVDWGGGREIIEEEDKEFLEKKEKLNQLEKELTNASKQAESLVKAQQKMGETFGELGLAFFKLTKFENEQATSVAQRNRASDMKGVATAAVKAGRFHRGLNAQCVKQLDTLHEYMGLMLAVHHAFSDRSSALLTVRTLISEVSSLHAKAKKLEIASSKNFGGDKSRPRKMDDLEEAIRVAEVAKHSALREYECIKENNRSEIERLDRERKVDFMNMLKGFVTNQVVYAEKIETEWAKVAEETSRYAGDGLFC